MPCAVSGRTLTINQFEKEAKMKSKELPLPAQLMNFIVGRWISKPIYVAAELGIADMLAEGPKSISEI